MTGKRTKIAVWRGVAAWTGLALAGFPLPARAELTVENLTGNAVTAVGPYVQDVSEAIKQFAAKDFAGAMAKLESAKKSTPRLAPPEVMMAQLYFDANFPQAANSFLEKCIRRAPQDPEPFVMLAERALAEGRLSEAEAMFAKGSKAAEAFAENQKRKQNLQIRADTGWASVDEARGDWKEAKAKLDALIKLDPRVAAPHERLGRVLFAMGDQKGAYAEFGLAAEADKKILPAELAMAHLFTDKLNAEKWLNFALKKNGQDPRTHLEVANYRLKNNQVAEARAEIDEALKLDPDGLNTNSTAGLVARMLGDNKGAVAHLSKAHLLAPSHPGVLNHLALSLLELPDNESRQRALEFAELNVKQNPANIEALSTLGWINYRLNRRREAERAFTAVMNSAAASNTMTSEMTFYLAHLAREQGNIPEAINMLKEALNTEQPFAYRKSAEELLSQLSKMDKSPKSKSDGKSTGAGKGPESTGKVGATK